MLKKKRWNWDRAVEGMQVVAIDLQKAQSHEGIVSEVQKSDNFRMIDGKPIKNAQTASVMILCNDGTEIVVARDSLQYQVELK